uniref:Intraflagellar transport 20 homolog (Chlamydomonas) n=1 Tax=Salmo trutta TaxID=8032 RepID=A0A673XTV2_SALTR
MAKDPLAEAGLHFDELNKLRVLEPEVDQKTTELKEECEDFVDKISQFQKIVGGLIELVDELAKEAETEKMKVRVVSFLVHLYRAQTHTHRCRTFCSLIQSQLFSTCQLDQRDRWLYYLQAISG